MLTGTFAQASNKADWIESIGLYDTDTSEAIDISDATEIVLEVKKDRCSSVLSGSMTGGEIDIIETGVFQFAFTADQMGGVDPGTYDVLCRITKGGTVVQLIIGKLPVVSG